MPHTARRRARAPPRGRGALRWGAPAAAAAPRFASGESPSSPARPSREAPSCASKPSRSPRISPGPVSSESRRRASRERPGRRRFSRSRALSCELLCSHGNPREKCPPGLGSDDHRSIREPGVRPERSRKEHFVCAPRAVAAPRPAQPVDFVHGMWETGNNCNAGVASADNPAA
jgi:hypothetical protein